MFDFTLSKYKQLMQALQRAGYEFVLAVPSNSSPKVGEVPGGQRGMTPRVSLRHDVDARLEAAVQMAELEHALGLRSTYYFRAREAYRQSLSQTLRRIISLGHEIGYHYEDLSLANGDPDLAWKHFCNELSYLRQFYPVHSACMHGAPRSRFDGRDLWKYYDYHQAGIDFEPYLDLDFSQILYLTDTGRRWDGYRVSVRDKILGYQEEWNRQGWSFHTTDDIIRAAEAHRLPDRLMLSTHPQRWAVNPAQWLSEATTQPLKNILKHLIIRHQL